MLLLKGLTQLGKKLSNIPELYAEMLNIFVIFHQQILRTLRDIEV